jgi:hypothetical protein
VQEDHGPGPDDEPTLVIAGIEQDPGYGMPRAGLDTDTADGSGAPLGGLGWLRWLGWPADEEAPANPAGSDRPRSLGLEWQASETPPADTGELPIPVTAVPATQTSPAAATDPAPDNSPAAEDRPLAGGAPLPLAPGALHPPHVLRRLALAVAAAVLLVGTVTVAALGAGGNDNRAAPVAQPSAARWASPAGPSGHVVSQPLDGRTESGLDLVSAASAVTVRSAALGAELYRISTPAGGVRPQATDAAGRVRLALDGHENGGRVVDIVLNERVRWDLSVAGGAEQHRIDLTGSRLRRVDLAGGSGRIVLTLPRPEGTLVVRMAGGVREFAVHTAGAVPVRVRVGSGAGRVVLGGRTHAGVAAGALFTPERWDDAGDRIDLDAAAGMSQLTVDGT